jgi:ABC-type sulfate transport system permease component
MNSLGEAWHGALALMASGDPTLGGIVALSLAVSLSAVLLATLLGLPLGAAIAVGRFPGRRALIVLLNALMGLPPVVVGLLVYLLLSRAGPLGSWGCCLRRPRWSSHRPCSCYRSSRHFAANQSRMPGSSTRSSCARWARTACAQH